jgi:hypothetical protein
VGADDSFPGSKVGELEADHSPPFNADVNIGGAIPPLPLRLHDGRNYLRTEITLPLILSLLCNSFGFRLYGIVHEGLITMDVEANGRSLI